jgi:putative transposase
MKVGKALARRHRRVANRRKDRNHQITTRLVRVHKLIVTEELAPSNMTASAKGTAQKPGRSVKAKAGLKRAILDATPGAFVTRLSIKAEDAGCELIVLQTRREKPSQTCPWLAGPFARKPWASVCISAAAGSRQRGTRRRHWRCLRQA